MKKIFILLASALIGLTANAQVFLGGNIGFTHDNPLTVTFDEVTHKTPSNGLNIGPEIGYRFNDKWSIGVGINYSPSWSKKNHSDEYGKDDTSVRTNRWDFSAFGRRSVWGTKGFNVCIQGKFTTSTFSSATNYVKNDITHIIDEEKISQDGFSVGLSLYPVLTYDLTRHLTVLANLDLLGVGYSFEKYTRKEFSSFEGEASEPMVYINENNRFDFNFNRKAEISLGIEYRF